MNYAFINPNVSLSHNGGVKVQALMWKEGLEKLGHSVHLVDFWVNNDWAKYDAIIVFGYGGFLRLLVNELVKINPNIVMAPIIDPNKPDYIYKFFCKRWGSQKYLGLTSRFHDLWLVREKFKLWLVRSEEERHFTNYCLERPQGIIKKVPLHFRIPIIEKMPYKENFCFHASRLMSPNKNVERLVVAAKKYGFILKLAGYLPGETGRKWLYSLIGGCSNIEYVGELSEQELQNLYKRARVFALPSLQEGVGMVALEAAAYGCEIVLTSYGAPKEYYDGKAMLVNPKSVDEIGEGIIKAMSGYAQPELKTYIEEHNSESACCKLLHESICNVIR